MNSGFRLFPESASSFSGQVDALFLFLVLVSMFFTGLICALILFFGVRYRRGSPASRENPPTSYLLEVTWSVIPLLVSMVMFGWGAMVFFNMQTPPSDAQEINVVAKQWMWKAQHAGGRAELNELHLPLGQPVRLRMISEDVIHSFYVPAFRVKQDVLPGYYTRLWFQPTKVGKYHLFCAEYCGTEHSLMRGRVIVMDPEDYADWLSGQNDEPPEVAGRLLFERYRCGTCHKAEGGGTGPVLQGVYGRQVPLQGGGSVLADDAYLRNSILNPADQIAAGFRPEMPTFRGQIDEMQILQLVAYLKTLSAPQSEDSAASSNKADQGSSSDGKTQP